MSRSYNVKDKSWNPPKRMAKEGTKKKHRSKVRQRLGKVMQGYDPDDMMWEDWKDADNIYWYD